MSESKTAMTEQVQSEEDALNVKRLMEQSVPFHEQSPLLRDIHWQWLSGKILTDRQKRAFITELNHLQGLALHHQYNCDCQKHHIIFVTVRVIASVRTFTGQDGVQYTLRPGNVVRLPLREATAFVFRRYADFEIPNALELTDRRHEVFHHV